MVHVCHISVKYIKIVTLSWPPGVLQNVLKVKEGLFLDINFDSRNGFLRSKWGHGKNWNSCMPKIDEAIIWYSLLSWLTQLLCQKCRRSKRVGWTDMEWPCILIYRELLNRSLWFNKNSIPCENYKSLFKIRIYIHKVSKIIALTLSVAWSFSEFTFLLHNALLLVLS